MARLATIGRRFYGVLVLCALGVGGTEVLAVPAQSSRAYTCNAKTCNADCVAMGAQGGSCNYMDDSCDCIW